MNTVAVNTSSDMSWCTYMYLSLDCVPGSGIPGHRVIGRFLKKSSKIPGTEQSRAGQTWIGVPSPFLLA